MWISITISAWLFYIITLIGQLIESADSSEHRILRRSLLTILNRQRYYIFKGAGHDRSFESVKKSHTSTTVGDTNDEVYFLTFPDV